MAEVGRFGMVTHTEGEYELQAGDNEEVTGRLQGFYNFDRGTGKLSDRDSGDLIGTFSCDFISEEPLPMSSGRTLASRKVPCISIEKSEVEVEIQKSSNSGAFFVLPAQLNGAIYPAHNHIIKKVEMYKAVDSGGPGVSGQLAVHPGAAQFVLDNAEHFNHLRGINAADKIIDRLRNAGERKEHGFIFEVINGYMAIPHITDKEKRDAAVGVLKENMHKLRLLVMNEVLARGLTPDKRALAAGEHRVNLIYASAVPVQAYLNYGTAFDQKNFQMEIAEMFLIAQYHGALKMAAQAAEECGTRLVIFLMPLGGGVLNNSMENIAKCMSDAVKMLSDEELDRLDVRVLHSNSNEICKLSEALRREDTLKEAKLPLDASSMFDMATPPNSPSKPRITKDEDLDSENSFDSCGSSGTLETAGLEVHKIYSDGSEEFDDAKSAEWWDDLPPQQPAERSLPGLDQERLEAEVEALFGKDPLVGLAVKVKKTGREGVLAANNTHDELSYKVEFSDGAEPLEDWFADSSIEFFSTVQDADTSADAASALHIGKLVQITADASCLEEHVKACGMSWPSGPSGKPWTWKLGKTGFVEEVDLDDWTVCLSSELNWTPLKSLVGFHDLSEEQTEQLKSAFGKQPEELQCEDVLHGLSKLNYDDVVHRLEACLSDLWAHLWALTKHKVHFGTAEFQDPEGDLGTYTGPLLDGKPHGIGKVEYDAEVKTGDLFVGEFAHGKMAKGVCYHRGLVKYTMRDGFWTNDSREWKVDTEIVGEAPAYREALAESLRKSKQEDHLQHWCLCEEHLRASLRHFKHWSSQHYNCGGYCMNFSHCLHEVFEGFKKHTTAHLCQDGKCISCETHVRGSLASLGHWCKKHDHCHGCGTHCLHGLQKVCEKLIAFKRRIFCQEHSCEVCCNHCTHHVCDGLLHFIEHCCEEKGEAEKKPPSKEAGARASSGALPIQEQKARSISSPSFEDALQANARASSAPSAVREYTLQVNDPVLCKDAMNKEELRGVVVEAKPGEPVKVKPTNWKRAHTFQHVSLDTAKLAEDKAKAEEEAARKLQELRRYGRSLTISARSPGIAAGEAEPEDQFLAKVRNFWTDLKEEVDMLHWKLNVVHLQVIQDYGELNFTDIDGDKCVYRGKLHNKVAHGIGRLDYEPGASADYFIGEFKYGKMYEGVCYRDATPVYTMTWGRWTHVNGRWRVLVEIVEKVPGYKATMQRDEQRVAQSKFMVEVGDQLDAFERQLLHAAAGEAGPQKGVVEIATRKFQRKGAQAAVSHVLDHYHNDIHPQVQSNMRSTCSCLYCFWLLYKPELRHQARTEQAKDLFFVDNSHLHAPTKGLAYRVRMNENSIHPTEVAPWGSYVTGYVENEHWISVNDLFLPVDAHGVHVLLKVDDGHKSTEGTAEAASSETKGDEVQHQYLVDNTNLHATTVGLAFRPEKSLAFKSETAMRWGSYVCGSDEDEQWIKVDDHFMPIFVNGIRVLTKCSHSPPSPRAKPESTVEAEDKPEHEYLIDNSEMLASTKGLAYRNEKGVDTELMTGEIAEWGTHVHGFDEDDQWIKVGDHFLPVFVQGIRVISKCDEGSTTLAEMATNITLRKDST